jgi:hypothetical protein
MTNNLVFMTSQAYFPDLGGTAPYDAECNRLASEAGINGAAGTAYVSAMSGPQSFLDRLGPIARGWVRMDGLPFGDLPSQLLGATPMVHYSVQYDEYGRRSYFGLVLSGTAPDGTVQGNCNDWTSRSADLQLMTIAGRNGPGWLGNPVPRCSSPTTTTAGDTSAYSILCLGTTKSAPLTLPRFTGKLMWVTNTPYVVGSMTPDQKCQLERPPSVSQAVAFIGYAGRVNSEVLDLEATYVRPDGQLVGTGQQVANLSTVGGPWITAEGNIQSPVGVWTGVGVPASTDTCNDWRDPLSTGSLGSLGADNWRAFAAGFGASCAFTAHLYCIER